MIRTRRALRTEITDLQAQLADAQLATVNARDRAEKAERESREGLKHAAHALEDAERRARAWRSLHRAAAATRDELATVITGETVDGSPSKVRDDLLRRVFGPAGRVS